MSYAEKDKASRLEDCGQSGVCELSPGCVRHFIERNAELVKERDEANAEVVQHKEERLRLRAEVSRLQRERDEAAQVGARAMAGLAAKEVSIWETAYPTESYDQLRKRILALTLPVEAANEGAKS